MAKVKGGRAALKHKQAKKGSKSGKHVVNKVLKFTPDRPQRVKGKKSVTSSNQKHKSLSSSPGNQGGKKSAAGTTDEMTMQTLKKFLQFQKQGG